MVWSPWFFGLIVFQSSLLKLNIIIYVCIFVPSQMGDTKSIFKCAQCVTLDSKTKCLSLAVFLFTTPTIKLKLELHIHGGLLIANHLDQITVIDQSEILSPSPEQFITLFLGGAQLCRAFYHPRHGARIWCGKTNFLSYTGTFWLFRNKSYCLESHTERRWRCSKSISICPSKMALLWMRYNFQIACNWVWACKFAQDTMITIRASKITACDWPVIMIVAHVTTLWK
jgi:hypothetical protein